MLNHGLISDSSSAKKYMKMNSDWIEFSDMQIKDYLDDYYGVDRGTGHSCAPINILMIIVTVFGAFY